MTALPLPGPLTRTARAGSLTGSLTDGVAWRTRARRVAEAALTPMVPADVLDMVAPLRAGADLRARVVAVEPETLRAATLVLRPGRDWAGHTPGQYLRLGVDVDGVRHWRAYSLTHGPRTDGLISVTVQAIEDGVVSNHLVRGLRPGDLLHLDQAAGDFTAPDPATPVLFVTAGSGITPVMGMLRHHRYADAVLVHSALTAEDVVFGAELRVRAARGEFRLVEFHTDRDGMLDVADLATLVPDLAARTTYACGPVGLLDALEAHHGDAGLPLHTERFRPSVVVTGEGGTLALARTATPALLEADGATPLLDVAEQAGVLMPSGCRMGICFGCVLPLVDGAVRDLRTGEVTTADPMTGAVPVQTCISAAAGPCTLDH
ncbi:ferredoxin reductase [Nocardioides sp.]|uniref:ferredoxin reductase n=1 Tax=Nocardioides sp. TaxID=35761 RepID=UPI003516FA09